MAAGRTALIGLKVALTICILATLYCFVGALQAVWLSATPNFPRMRTIRDLEIWGSGTLLSLIFVGWCGVSLWKRRQN